GGNVTGFSLLEFSLGSKWLGLLKEIAPGLAQIAFMFAPDTTPYFQYFMPVIENAALSFGMQIIAVPIRATIDIDPALSSFVRQPNGGLMLLGRSFTLLHQKLITDLAGRFRLPSISNLQNFAKDGGLMSYGPNVDLVHQSRQAATYVDRILKGTKAADLPLQAPTKYELLINLKTAKALGLTVPNTLLARADEVIE